ncbi:MAG: carboxypeptidase-like regulatory domain-containing protein, partial [Pyrinomonadaceae bacterium]
MPTKREPRKNADTIIYMPQTNRKRLTLLRWSMMVALSLSVLALVSLSGVISNSGRSFAQDGATREKRNLSPSASSGSTNLFMLTGSGASLAFGDYVSNSTTLNTSYKFFIEVPQGLPRLVVELFDADIGRGGTAEATAGRDRDRGGFDTSVTYTLTRPDGTTATTLTCNATTCTDNAWQAVLDSTSAQNTAAGHWQLTVNMSSGITTGDDINALGIRAHDGTSGAGGTELNVYFDSVNALGVNPPASGTQSRSYALYPYITSGASFAKNDFDFDSNSGTVGSVALTSRTGEFTQNFASATMSADNVWVRNSVTGWTTDTAALDYGIWNANVTISSYLVGGTPNGNYADLYFSNFQSAVNPPTANPATNAFRVYLPTDSGTAPAKPYLSQLVSHLSGPKSPLVGQTSTFIVFIHLNNPTSRAVTFSTPANIVTSNVPGAGAVYAGFGQVNQGTLLTQPAVGGTGNVTWNPGAVAAGARATLSYRISVTPTSNGQRIPVTATPASGNGTRAQYVDETGNTTQARSTYLFGPLAEVAVTAGVPTAAPALVSGQVTDGDGAPLGGVTINLSGGKQARTITDSNGYYRFEAVD